MICYRSPAWPGSWGLPKSGFEAKPTPAKSHALSLASDSYSIRWQCKRYLPRKRRRLGRRATVQSSFPADTALLLTAKQAAKALAISPRKLWSMTASGEIPHLRIGRSVRYPVDGLQAFINARKEGGDSR